MTPWTTTAPITGKRRSHGASPQVNHPLQPNDTKATAGIHGKGAVKTKNQPQIESTITMTTHYIHQDALMAQTADEIAYWYKETTNSDCSPERRTAVRNGLAQNIALPAETAVALYRTSRSDWMRGQLARFPEIRDMELTRESTSSPYAKLTDMDAMAICNKLMAANDIAEIIVGIKASAVFSRFALDGLGYGDYENEADALSVIDALVSDGRSGTANELAAYVADEDYEFTQQQLAAILKNMTSRKYRTEVQKALAAAAA